MNDQILYLLKVSLGMAVIVIPYIIFLRNDSNLILKRIYLLTGMAAAWTFPLLSFRKPELIPLLSPEIAPASPAITITPEMITSSESVAASGIEWFKIILIIYFTGLFLLFLKNIFQLNMWNRIWHKSREGASRVAYTQSDQIFTIFNRIFLPGSLKNNRDSEAILLHEQAHIRQLHFIDLVLVECTLLLTWFNPFSWLISRMIKENHEHLADREVLSRGVNPAHYRAQLLNQSLGVTLFRLGHQFNHSLTKKRFTMMKKTRSTRIGLLKLIMLAPAILLLLGLFSGTSAQEPESKVKGKVIIASSGEAAPGASIVIKGTTVGTVSDLKGEFFLEVDGDPEVVISFVGFENQQLKASELSKKPIALEVTTYQKNLSEKPLKITKKENDSFVIKSKGDGNEQPVFVVDGKKVEHIEDLDPEDIESVEVYKDMDHELVKKYKAEDGLIVINTKNASAKNQPEDKNSGHKGDEVFYVVEELPSYPGGDEALREYIYSNLEYPASAKKKGITGEVKVQFTVKNSGKLENIKVAESSNKSLNEAAMAPFESMPSWNPGKQRGKPVNVQLIVPVKFNLPSE